MKLSCAFFVVTAALSVRGPSLGANAFQVAPASYLNQPVVGVQGLHEKSPSAAADGDGDSETVSSSTSWFANNNKIADSIFDAIDTDKDGSVSNEELRLHLEEIGYSANSIRSLFATIDKNADGAIDREEMRFAFDNYDLLALYQAFGVGVDDVANDKRYNDAVDKIRSNAGINTIDNSMNVLADLIFDQIDTDKSGEIDVNELKEHFETLTTSDKIEQGGVFYNDKDDDDDSTPESILKALDLNSDGVICREEMRLGFSQFNPKSLLKALGVRAPRF